jgi:hypothetical protein
VAFLSRLLSCSSLATMTAAFDFPASLIPPKESENARDRCWTLNARRCLAAARWHVKRSNPLAAAPGPMAR